MPTDSPAPALAPNLEEAIRRAIDNHCTCDSERYPPGGRCLCDDRADDVLRAIASRTPADAVAVRGEALEEAARVCAAKATGLAREAKEAYENGENNRDLLRTANEYSQAAFRIRTLKPASPQGEPVEEGKP